MTQPAPACSEHELVAAVRRGDDRAFEELYSRFRRRIAAYVFGMVGDHGRAEDITQEVFISALRRMRDSERPIAFKPWVYEIAKNACIDEFRRTRRTQEVPLESNDDDDTVVPHPVLMSSAATPDVAVESRQQLNDLRGAFRGLSENHHKILVLRELEGLSYTQIGEQMGMTRPVVESTLFRARRRLTEEYEELVTGRRCEQVQAVISSPSTRRGRGLGIRQQRMLARHLAHCQPCRRHAHLAGFDDSALQPAGVIGKIAAILPFPIGLWRWRRGGGGNDAAVAARGSHPLGAIQSVQTISTYAGPSSPLSGLGRTAAAAATLVIAGAGGGIVAGVTSHSSSSPRISHGPLPASIASGSGLTRGGLSAAGAGAGARTSRGSGGSGASHSAVAHGAAANAATTARGGSAVATGAGTLSGQPSNGAGASEAAAGTVSPTSGGGASNSGPTGPDSSTQGSGGSNGATNGGTGLTLPSTPSVTGLPTVHGVPGVGSLPTIALPQLPSVSVPKPSALLKPVLGSLTGSGGGGGSGGTGGADSSASTNSTSGASNTTSGSSGSEELTLGDVTGAIAPIVNKLKGK
jgi:RNA polymerase sigma factor (sigma-70 family)